MQNFKDAKLFFQTVTRTGNDKLSTKSSGLQCILQHALQDFYWFIYRIYVQISHTSEKHDKRRTLGSEIVFILKRVNSENTLHFSACMPKRPYYLVKKVISCNRSVHSSRLRISDFYAKLVKRLNQRSQQDGFLSSRAMLSQPYIVSTVFFFF